MSAGVGMLGILGAGAAGVLVALFVPAAIGIILVGLALVIALLPQMMMLRIPAVVFALSVLVVDLILYVGISRLAEQIITLV